MESHLYHDASVFIIVYAIDEYSTFESVSNYIDKINEKCKSDPIKILVGHKCDLIDARKVEMHDLIDKANEHNFDLYFETSSLPEYKNTIEVLFDGIVNKFTTKLSVQNQNRIKLKP